MPQATLVKFEEQRQQEMLKKHLKEALKQQQVNASDIAVNQHAELILKAGLPVYAKAPDLPMIGEVIDAIAAYVAAYRRLTAAEGVAPTDAYEQALSTENMEYWQLGDDDAEEGTEAPPPRQPATPPKGDTAPPPKPPAEKPQEKPATAGSVQYKITPHSYGNFTDVQTGALLNIEATGGDFIECLAAMRSIIGSAEALGLRFNPTEGKLTEGSLYTYGEQSGYTDYINKVAPYTMKNGDTGIAFYRDDLEYSVIRCAWNDELLQALAAAGIHNNNGKFSNNTGKFKVTVLLEKLKAGKEGKYASDFYQQVVSVERV